MRNTLAATAAILLENASWINIASSLPHAAPPYHEVTITTDPPEGPFPLGSTVILQCSVTPPPPEGVTYHWTDSIPSTSLSSTRPNLTLTIPAHHPSQGHYYCTVYNGSSVLAVGSTTIRVRGELDIPAACYCSFHVLIQACIPLYVTVNGQGSHGRGSLWSLVYKSH